MKKKKYDNVDVYSPGTEARYLADDKWTNKKIDAPEFEKGSKEWLAKKDIEMSKAANEGIAVILDEGAKATKRNIERLMSSGKEVSVYELNQASKKLDKWLDEKGKGSIVDAVRSEPYEKKREQITNFYEGKLREKIEDAYKKNPGLRERVENDINGGTERLLLPGESGKSLMMYFNDASLVKIYKEYSKQYSQTYYDQAMKERKSLV